MNRRAFLETLVALATVPIVLVRQRTVPFLPSPRQLEWFQGGLRGGKTQAMQAWLNFEYLRGRQWVIWKPEPTVEDPEAGDWVDRDTLAFDWGRSPGWTRWTPPRANITISGDAIRASRDAVPGEAWRKAVLGTWVDSIPPAPPGTVGRALYGDTPDGYVKVRDLGPPKISRDVHGRGGDEPRYPKSEGRGKLHRHDL